MFYAHFVLSKKGPLARIWLAAHWDKKLTRAHVFETNISSSVEAILEPKLKMALRTSGHLLLGVVRIYSRKAKYLLADCNEAFVKIKMAFRPGVVDLPDEANREAAIAAITLPENIHDFEATIADLNEINMNTITINQSRPEDITMREDFGEINLGRQDDDFGDSAFDEVSSREIIREGDKTFGDGIYRGSGSLSVRGGTDFSIRSDPDLDTTLIGGNQLDGKHKHHEELGVARPDDIGIDDNDFAGDLLGPADDDDENFGGEIDHSLFADGGIFEDPSAQQQLEHLTSEIESHMDKAGLGLHNNITPIPSSGTANNEVVVGHSGTPLDADPTTTTIEPFVITSTESVSEPNLTGAPLINVTSNRSGATNTVHGESTTLLTNESEAFALPPIDATSVVSTEIRRPGKRKRRLIVDEMKSIPSETMKLQMEDTSDITTQLDLAPPTKQLMRWKETGSVDKLFTLPGRSIPSRVLQRLFVCNLHTVSLPDDIPEEQMFYPLYVGSVPQSSSVPTSSAEDGTMEKLSHVSLQNQLPDGTAHEESGMKSPALSTSVSNIPPPGLGPAGHKLDVIQEVSEDTVSQLQHMEDEQLDHNLHQPMDDYDDNDMHDGLAFMGEPYIPPPSVLSEAPPSVMQVDMLALERELAGVDHEAENQLALAFDQPDVDGVFASPPPAPMDLPSEEEDEEEEEEEEGVTVETMEERRLEKRSKVLLRTLRTHQQQSGWNEPLSLQSICTGNTKKQAASKFYTVLLLRKQRAVELHQEAAYSDIMVSRGPAFNHLIDV